MGLLEKSDKLYLTVSCGKMTNKKREISTFGVVGWITKISEKEDEYEGQVISKILIDMTDKKENFCVQFTTESWYSIGFFSRLKSIDLSKQITLGVSGSEKNEKISFCWMKQPGNKNVNEKGSIIKDESFPAPEKKTIGKKEIYDWTLPLAKMGEIMEWANEKISASLPEEIDKEPEFVPDVVPSIKDQVKAKAAKNAAKQPSTSDLPF